MVDVQTGEIIFKSLTEDLIRETVSFGRKRVYEQIDSFFRGILCDRELQVTITITIPKSVTEQSLFENVY